MSRRFAAEWLALREPADAAARARSPGSAALARRFAAALPRPARIIDLGAGTGANARALAPTIGGDQEWWLVDSDPALGAVPVTFPAAAGGCRRCRRLALDLGADWDRIAAMPADGVTCSAFLDLASAAWLERLAAWLAERELPFLAALSVDGRRQWSPPAPEDAAVQAAFRRHQGRDKGLGPALGDMAATVIGDRLRTRGFAVTTAASDWRLGRADATLLAALAAGEAKAAAKAVPDRSTAIAAWRARRLNEAAAGTLSVTIGHCDVLALPPRICEKGPATHSGEAPPADRL